MVKNPFSKNLTRGNGLYFGRDNEISELIEGYETGVDDYWATLVTGVRGSGKTIFMREIQKEMESRKDWCVVWVNNSSNVYADVVNRLHRKLGLNNRKKVSGGTLGPLGWNVNIVDDLTSDFEDALEYAQSLGLKVLIIVDELKKSDASVDMLSAMVSMFNNDYKIHFLSAGLPENISHIITATDVISSMLRSHRITLKPVEEISVFADAYYGYLDISYEVAEYAASKTLGYGYAFQLLGYIMWERNVSTFEDVDNCLPEFETILYQNVYNVIIGRLSKNDLILLRKIVDGASSVQVVRKLLGWSRQNVNQYKNRLAESMIIGQTDLSDRGSIKLLLPSLDYTLEMLGY